MSPADLQALLARLSPVLRARGDWMVIGSAALMILGLPLEDCADLDILTSDAGAAAFEAAWASWRAAAYAPDPAAPFLSRFSRYAAPEGVVEVMGDLRVRQGGVWTSAAVGRVETRRVGDLDVSTPAPAEQLRLLRLFGRPKDLAKAERLQRWLARG